MEETEREKERTRLTAMTINGNTEMQHTTRAQLLKHVDKHNLILIKHKHNTGT